MTVIAGALNIQNAERVRINTVGQDVVFEIAAQYAQRASQEVLLASSVFVQGMTENYQERYKLGGSGYMSKSAGYDSAPAFKATGEWDVAYPLYQVHEALVATDVDLGYFTVAELDLQIGAKITRWRNQYRRDLLTALFKNTTTSFADPLHGTLTVQPLANGDAVVYPPRVGAVTEATDDHYLETGYAVAAISNTNNPAKTLRAELSEHFEEAVGGSNVVMWADATTVDALSGLTDYVPVQDNYIRAGANADIPQNLPSVPGTIRGRLSGVWVVEWAAIPANYAYGQFLGAPAPVKMRVDPSDTGFVQGALYLVQSDEKYPFRNSVWRSRYGFGVGNRLNGVCLEFGTGGTYTIPTIV